VPTTEQLATAAAKDIPGGFLLLRSSDIDRLEVTVNGDEVELSADDHEVMTRTVTDRLRVRDAEGSGPFKGEKEVLVLGKDPLVIGSLTITDPVIWPGSFEDSPVITIKSRNDQERGPGVSCLASETCLLLTSGADPLGRYEDANNPQLGENPIATIAVLASSIEFTLDSGQVVDVSRSGEGSTDACGLSESATWDVPATVGLAMVDPVLVYAACPTTPGDTRLVIMNRDDIPVLAPLGAESGGEWCSPASDCLLFVPTD
ncbi:MAG: hypothetical protein WA726_06645, partial [Acidimicrobiia bacterium]